MKFPLHSAVLAAMIIAACNASNSSTAAVAFGGRTVLVLIVSYFLCKILTARNGGHRYEAVVFVREYGHTQQLWSGRFRFRWIARLKARQMASRINPAIEMYLTGTEWLIHEKKPPFRSFQ